MSPGISKEQFFKELDLEFKEQVAEIKRDIKIKANSMLSSKTRLIPEETSFKVTSNGVVDTRNGKLLRTIGEVLMVTMM